jgi:hypothetical protein
MALGLERLLPLGLCPVSRHAVEATWCTGLALTNPTRMELEQEEGKLLACAIVV